MKNDNGALLLEAIINIYKTLYNVANNNIELYCNKVFYHNLKKDKYNSVIRYHIPSTNNPQILELMGRGKRSKFPEVKDLHNICRCLFSRVYEINDNFLRIPNDVPAFVEASKYDKDELLLWLRLNNYNIDGLLKIKPTRR